MEPGKRVTEPEVELPFTVSMPRVLRCVKMMVFQRPFSRALDDVRLISPVWSVVVMAKRESLALKNW